MVPAAWNCDQNGKALLSDGLAASDGMPAASRA